MMIWLGTIAWAETTSALAASTRARSPTCAFARLAWLSSAYAPALVTAEGTFALARATALKLSSALAATVMSPRAETIASSAISASASFVLVARTVAAATASGPFAAGIICRKVDRARV